MDSIYSKHSLLSWCQSMYLGVELTAPLMFPDLAAPSFFFLCLYNLKIQDVKHNILYENIHKQPVEI